MLRPVLVLVLLLAAGALAWFSLRPVDPAPVANARPAAPPVKILVTGQPLQAGTLLKDADFREREVPADAAADGSLVANDDTRAEIRGAMLRRYFESGEIVHRADVLRPRDRGFLAAVLAPGTRAVSIGVDAKTGASGLISPGDLVDVILAQEFARGETPAGRRVVAETVLSTARVIAVDQQIAQGAPTGSSIPGAATNRVASTVSLQVTPEQAGRVVVAERLGRLTLVVRSIDGKQAIGPGATELGAKDVAQALEKTPPPPPSVFGSDVSTALSQEEPAASPRLRLIQGDAVSDVVFR
jgi:pilus assembly protein CpaB